MNSDLARAIAHLKCAAESIELIKARIDPNADQGVPRLVIGHALCCAIQCRKQLDRFRSECGDELPATPADVALTAAEAEALAK